MQGPVIENQTVEVLKSIRGNFHDSKIILSTWEDTNINFDSNLYDDIIFNKDPGCFFAFLDQKNNVDRQVVSTLNGLKACKTKYAFKIRTDFRIVGDNFLNYFGVFDKFNKEYKIVNKRILACTNATRNPYNKYAMNYPFHISDFAFFGLTEDLLKLFDIPLTPKEDKDYFFTHQNLLRLGGIVCRFIPEQWILMNLLKNNGKKTNFEYATNFSKENSKLTELYITNNFVLLNLEQFNLNPFKTQFLTKNNLVYLETCYTYHDFLKMYKKYCDNNYLIPILDKERSNSFFVIKKFKRLFIKPILKPIINVICWFVKNKDLKRKIREIYY